MTELRTHSEAHGSTGWSGYDNSGGYLITNFPLLILLVSFGSILIALAIPASSLLPWRQLTGLSAFGLAFLLCIWTDYQIAHDLQTIMLNDEGSMSQRKQAFAMLADRPFATGFFDEGVNDMQKSNTMPDYLQELLERAQRFRNGIIAIAIPIPNHSPAINKQQSRKKVAQRQAGA